MGETKFSCAKCGQRIQCDESWCGHALACPSCQSDLRVPISAAIGRQVLAAFHVSAEAQAQWPAETSSLNFALSEALARSPLAIQSDWKRGPEEIMLGFKQCLEASAALGDVGIRIEIEPGEADTGLGIVLSLASKPPVRYRWPADGQASHHDVAFAFADLLPEGLSVFSAKAFEETDTVLYLVAPRATWTAMRQLLNGCFDELYACHQPKHRFQAVRTKNAKGRRVDWRKLWDIYAGPTTKGSPEKINQNLEILRPFSAANLVYGPDGTALRTNAIGFLISEISGKPLESWRIEHNPECLPLILYSSATAARVGALWNLYARRTLTGKEFWGNCLGKGHLIWAYFIYAAMGCHLEAQECGQLLELEKVRKEERSSLGRNQISYFDLALFLHNETRGDELNALEPMLALTRREGWLDPAAVEAALNAHCQTRGEQFVHDCLKWTWPATLYGLARRAGALDCLPRDNPFLDTPLDISQVDQAHPWLEFFRELEQRYRALA
jgi:hypothetical protein